MKMKRSDLESASIEELLKLRKTISDFIERHIQTEKHALQVRLDKLNAFPDDDGSPIVRRHKRRATKGRKVPIKYRNPNKRQETWSGRGRTPRWLVAAMKATGKKVEDFRV
jgi:DNA-binding protein H-NS